jgi:hypothetical protein
MLRLVVVTTAMNLDEHYSAASIVITAPMLRFSSEYSGAENSTNTL